MFERFTEQARQVVVQAQGAARDLGHAYIGTEHILLGLLVVTDDIAAQVLDSFGVQADGARRRLVEISGSGEPVVSGQIPFTPPAKKTLELGLREALALGHNSIGTGHLLLGLLRIDDGLSSQILLDLNVQPSDVREEMVRRLSGPEGEALRGGPARVVRHTQAIHAGDTGEFTVEPDGELRRLMMTAAGKARKEGRQQFTLADLLAVVEDPGR